ncbi:OmpH family outer membrane protein [Flavimaricola marinus]|uniref:Outer membrane protein (OmpH-like) n=1 Tax=Flavimaricola marinus TaxID=1819565 RepID=A0A238LDI7_9RHOB|nr:OmpH family outer membrane protein [Flavimaricola marinus]SMY07484.1 Outer membrane protein (OmpH-like) [Flavimaricola marinus]
MWAHAIRGGLVGLALSIASVTAAQQPSTAQGQIRSPVLTIDADRLFGETLFGARVLAELGAATEALAAENRVIETTLQEEVDSLTARRPTMDVATFRQAADAFDTRVQRIRQEQDAKEAGLQQALAQGREAFLAAATPVLGQLMVDSGAVVILDRRTVFLSVGIVDVTDEAVAAIDAALGDGTGLDATVPETDVPVELNTPAPNP